MFVEYGEKEKAYLAAKDKRLGAVIGQVGHISRPMDSDLFASLINSIVGQQISTKAHVTVWRRMVEHYGEITPRILAESDAARVQSFGMSMRKAEYIMEASRRVHSGQLDLQHLSTLPDEEIKKRLSALPGIGVWTAEMLMTFSMGRPDVLSYGDLAIQRGLRMVYGHKKISKELFEKYRKRYSPYGTTAALYIWAVAGGACPQLVDKKEAEVKKV